MMRRELEYFLAAVRFFTRLPVPAWVGHTAAGLNAAARWFPAVGALIGALTALVYLLAVQIWPQAVALLLSMAASIYLTGAFHEDGLADSVDGLGGGWEKMRILEIMKDSRIGNYGAIALWLALSGKFVLLNAQNPALLPLILLAGHTFSRACAVSLLAVLDYVREDQLSKAKPLATRLSPGACIFALFCGLLPLFWLPWPQALAGALLAGGATIWFARKCQRWLGGYTGDCLGATQQLAEIAFYLGLLAHWPL